MVQELSKRAAKIHSGTVDASVDNMLCVTNDGRKIGLDVRLMNPLPQLQRMAYLLQMCSNNLNQYAKAANENGRVYVADMEDLRQRLDELIDIGRQILSRLAEL